MRTQGLRQKWAESEKYIPNPGPKTKAPDLDAAHAHHLCYLFI